MYRGSRERDIGRGWRELGEGSCSDGGSGRLPQGVRKGHGGGESQAI